MVASIEFRLQPNSAKAPAAIHSSWDLLTLTYYTPYNHNIAFLRSLAEGLDRRLHGIWPETNRSERAMFQKLKEAYTKARYSKHYRITEEELVWLDARVEELGRVVHQVCSERIAELEASARG